MQKTYIDTNILIAYVSGPQKDPFQYPKAKRIFDEIKQGKYVGVFSTLTLIEVKGVLRSLLGRERSLLQTIDMTQQIFKNTFAPNSRNRVHPIADYFWNKVRCNRF